MSSISAPVDARYANDVTDQRPNNPHPRRGHPEDPSQRANQDPSELITVPIKVPKSPSEKKGLLSSIKSKVSSSSSSDYDLKSLTMTRAHYNAHYRRDAEGNYIGTEAPGYDGSELEAGRGLSDQDVREPHKKRNVFLDGEGLMPKTVTDFVGRKLDEKDERKAARERIIAGEEREGDSSRAADGSFLGGGRMAKRGVEGEEKQGEVSSKPL